MGTTTVRVSDEVHRALKSLAEDTGESMHQVLARALELYRRQRFWDAVDEGYRKLGADPEAWAEELAERALWDSTLLDGLHDDPYEGEPGGKK